MKDTLLILLVYLACSLVSSAQFIINPYAFSGGGSGPDLSSGLLAFYDFEEGSGTTVGDASPNGNDASFQGSPTWEVGHKGSYAVGLKGATDLDFVTRAGMTHGNDDLTVACWVRFDSDVGVIVSEYKNGQGNWYLSYSNATRAFTCRIFDSLGGNFFSASPGPYPSGDHPGNNGNWYHILVTYKSSTGVLNVYVNGSLYSGNSTGLGGTIKATQRDLVIGGYVSTNGSTWDSGTSDVEVDNLRIYDRVVTSEEIAAIYAE